MTQATRIKTAILDCLDRGITNKQEIYNIITKKMDVPRPTVRRYAAEVKKELQRKLDVLSMECKVRSFVPSMEVTN